MDNKMNDFVNKMGATKGLSIGVKLVAGVGLAAYGLANSMFTGNLKHFFVSRELSYNCRTRVNDNYYCQANTVTCIILS